MFGKYNPAFFIRLDAKLIDALLEALTPISPKVPSALYIGSIGPTNLHLILYTNQYGFSDKV